MYTKILHILLVATVIACPLVCDFGLCCCHGFSELQPDENLNACSCCSSELCDPANLEFPSAPDKQKPCQPDPCEKGNCLCNGAIVAGVFEIDSLDIEGVAFQLFQANDYFSPHLPVATGFDHRIRLGLTGLPVSGRTIRCLHMSFLI